MPDWRQVTDKRELSCPEIVFDTLQEQLRPADREAPRLIATPQQWYDQRQRLHRWPVALMVTTERVLLGKNKLFGRIEIHDFHISEFKRYSVGLFMGGGPSWELYEELDRGQLKFVFRTEEEADFVGEYINSGVAMWRARQ